MDLVVGLFSPLLLASVKSVAPMDEKGVRGLKAALAEAANGSGGTGRTPAWGNR